MHIKNKGHIREGFFLPSTPNNTLFNVSSANF
jgi:hypothetical protein